MYAIKSNSIKSPVLSQLAAGCCPAEWVHLVFQKYTPPTVCTRADWSTAPCGWEKRSAFSNAVLSF